MRLTVRPSTDSSSSHSDDCACSIMTCLAPQRWIASGPPPSRATQWMLCRYLSFASSQISKSICQALSASTQTHSLLCSSMHRLYSSSAFRIGFQPSCSVGGCSFWKRVYSRPKQNSTSFATRSASSDSERRVPSLTRLGHSCPSTPSSVGACIQTSTIATFHRTFPARVRTLESSNENLTSCKSYCGAIWTSSGKTDSSAFDGPARAAMHSFTGLLL